MTPKQVMCAYKAIHELTRCVLPYKTSRSVHRLKTRLVEEFDTILNTEKSIVEKHGGKLKEGTYAFDTEKAALAFNNEYEAFLDQEDKIELPHVDVSRCIDAVRISPAAIEALEGLVYFGED